MKVKTEYDEATTRLLEQLTKVLKTYDEQFIEAYAQAGYTKQQIHREIQNDIGRKAIIDDIGKVYATTIPTMIFTFDKDESL